MFSKQAYIHQYVKKPFFSITKWAATTGVAVPQSATVDETTNGAMFIYAYVFVGVMTNGTGFQLKDTNGITLFDFGNVASTGGIITVNIQHLVRSSKISFISGNITSFSIGYQWISEWPTSMERKSGNVMQR